jgi:hypothetical protein
MGSVVHLTQKCKHPLNCYLYTCILLHQLYPQQLSRKQFHHHRSLFVHKLSACLMHMMNLCSKDSVANIPKHAQRMHAEKIWNLAKYRCFFPLAVQGRDFWNEQCKGTRVCWKAARHKSKHNRRIFLQRAPRSATSTEGKEEEEEGVRRCFVVLVHDRS